MGITLIVYAKYDSDPSETLSEDIQYNRPLNENETPATPKSTYQTPRSVEHFLVQVEQPLYRFAYRSLKNEQDALEAVQDALLKWVEKQYSHKPAEEWRPLVYRILQNRLNDIRRHRQVVGKVMRVFHTITQSDDTQDALESAPAKDSAQPDQIGDNQAFVTALAGALQALPERQRQAFQYRIGEGLSTKETAVAMGCGEGSVMTHLSRANHALRKALKHFHETGQ